MATEIWDLVKKNTGAKVPGYDPNTRGTYSAGQGYLYPGKATAPDAGDTTSTSKGTLDAQLAALRRNQQAAADAAAASAAAAAAAAKKAAKDQSVAENKATKDIVDSLFASLGKYKTGRDQQISNAESIFNTAIGGIEGQYLNAAGDAEAYAKRNEQDYDSKANANVTNMIREKGDALEQVLAVGAGETDALKVLLQATRQFDENQTGVSSAFNDTLRSINSQLQSAGSSAENARLNTWQQKQEALSSAWADFNKNMADTYTNIQRTEAGNSNIDSDYSVGYKKQLKNAPSLISKYTGEVREIEEAPTGWAGNWASKKDDFESTAKASNRAAAVSVGKLRKAEGATGRSW